MINAASIQRNLCIFDWNNACIECEDESLCTEWFLIFILFHCYIKKNCQKYYADKSTNPAIEEKWEVLKLSLCCSTLIDTII